VVPNITAGTDALTYDPLNRTVYVINGTAPYYITGIDLAYKTVSTQAALPGSPELNMFNPVDGLIYQVITDGDNKNAGAGLTVYDPYANIHRRHTSVGQRDHLSRQRRRELRQDVWC
jgi:hypothetical protein